MPRSSQPEYFRGGCGRNIAASEIRAQRDWRKSNRRLYGVQKRKAAHDLAIRRALESAGVEFIDENGGGPGVRLRKRHQRKS